MDKSILESLVSLAEPFTVQPQQRTPDQIDRIQQLIQNSRFFKSIESDSFSKELCQFLTLEIFEPHERVTSFGDILEKCYIIIYGGLNVLIPELNSPMSISQKQVKETLIRQTTILRKNTIDPSTLKDLIPKLRSSIGIRTNTRRTSIKTDTDFIRKLSKLSEFKISSSLQPGDSFGDYIFTSQIPCNSYTESKTITICAVLTKEDYAKASELEEDRKNHEKTEFLHKIPIFTNSTRASLLKLAASFQVQKYTKNQVVYREDLPADTIYFIESGDFQVSKCQDTIRKKIIEIPMGFLSSQKSLLKIENARDIKHSHQIQVAIRGRFEVLGYDEVYNKQSFRNHSCKCISVNGVLYAIKVEDFKQRIVDPEAQKYLQARIESNVQREKFLEGAGKLMASMSKTESKPVIQISSLARGDEYLKNLISSMHEKKTEKKAVNMPSSPWRNLSVDYSFLEKPRKVASNFKGNSLSPKGSDAPLPMIRVKERLRRVPPPNFMIGMRDLQRVYDHDLRAEQSPQRSRNLSSIY